MKLQSMAKMIIQYLLQTNEAILDVVRVDAERGELVEAVLRPATRPAPHAHHLEMYQSM